MSKSLDMFVVYQATPSTEISFEQNALVYEDENCEVVYNLWSEGGNIRFCHGSGH